jgi:hypothetical protein
MQTSVAGAGPPAMMAGMAQPEWQDRERAESIDQIPPGHSVSAHLLFGQCCHCRGVQMAGEVALWRTWARTRIWALRQVDDDPA